MAQTDYLKEINATKAWNTTVGDSLLVGVLDTGVDANHPDLDVRPLFTAFGKGCSGRIVKKG